MATLSVQPVANSSDADQPTSLTTLVEWRASPAPPWTTMIAAQAISPAKASSSSGSHEDGRRRGWSSSTTSTEATFRKLASRAFQPGDSRAALEGLETRLTVSRPVGGILSSLQRGLGGHPSVRSTWGLPLSRRADGPPMSLARPCSGWGLPSRTGHPVRWCALTAPFHPCLCGPEPAIGGLFSVALSCGSPRLAVSQHPALRSPDLPRPGPPARRHAESRPPGRLTVAPSVAGPAPRRHILGSEDASRPGPGRRSSGAAPAGGVETLSRFGGGPERRRISACRSGGGPVKGVAARG
jgi:hypothetical protein